jgi:hypothetical protein
VRTPDRGLLTVAVLVLIGAAILGYKVGHGHPSSASGGHARPAFAGSLLLEYSPGWRQAGTPRAIPGLPLTEPVVYAPEGNSARAGLISGQLPGATPAPLPASLLGRLHVLPDTQVVNFVETEGYRYSEVHLPGLELMLTIYAIPSSVGNTTVLACYAAAGFSAELRTCESTASTLRLAGQQHSFNLAPEPAYAAKVSALVGALDRERLRVREEMSRRATLDTVQQLARHLTASLASAAAALSSLEAPPAAGQAQAALSRAILQAKAAYTALGSSAQARELASYEVAQKQVYDAEGVIDTALESYALLGYAHTSGG